MFQWRIDVDMVHAWNFSRRFAPTFEEFVSEMDVLLRNSLMMLVIDKETGIPIGYGQSYSTSTWDRWTYVAAYLVPQFRGLPHFPETLLLAVDLLFKWQPLNKLYVEVYEFAGHLYQLLPALGFVEEGTTPNHYWHDGQFWSVTRMALYRDRWVEGRKVVSDILKVRERATSDRRRD